MMIAQRTCSATNNHRLLLQQHKRPRFAQQHRRMQQHRPPAAAGAAPAAAAAAATQQRLRLQLYDDPHSEYCAKVKVALHHKGLRWETLSVKPCSDGSASRGAADSLERFKRRAPLGKIPALVVVRVVEPPAARSASTSSGTGGAGDNNAAAAEAALADPRAAAEVVLYESEVINEWLEEQFPQPPLLPSEPLQRSKVCLRFGWGEGWGGESVSGKARQQQPLHAKQKLSISCASSKPNTTQHNTTQRTTTHQARLISRFHDMYLEPALRRLYPLVSPNPDAAAVHAAGAEFYAHLQQLDGLLPSPQAADSSGSGSGSGCYAVGERLSLADCGYPALLHYADIIFPAVGLGDLDYSRTPQVAEWRATLRRDPAVIRVLEELAPAAEEWLQRKLAAG